MFNKGLKIYPFLTNWDLQKKDFFFKLDSEKSALRVTKQMFYLNEVARNLNWNHKINFVYNQQQALF